MKNRERVREVFAKSLGIGLDEVTEALSYNARSEWDSVAHMVLVAALEEAFGIMLDTSDIIDMSSVEKAIEILKKYGVDL